MFSINQAAALQRPELVATEAQIVHANRKMNNAAKNRDDLSKNKTQLETKVNALQQELSSVKKAAERAQGMFLPVITRRLF